MAAAVLGADSSATLVKGWEARASRHGSDVPVYIVRHGSLAESDLVFVPPGERCIFVSDAVIDELPDLFLEGEIGMEVDPERYLALILLHEVGHIQLGHESGSFNDPDPFDSLLNLHETDQKDREIAADRFAVDQILAASKRDYSSGGMEALNLQLSISSISFNITGFLRVTNFGSSSTYSPKLYWDDGYSHPNFALRILVMQALLDGSEDSRAIVQDFIESRERRPYQRFHGTIASLDELAQVAGLVGHEVTRISSTQVELTYGPTGETALVEVMDQDEQRAVREAAEFLGIEYDE